MNQISAPIHPSLVGEFLRAVDLDCPGIEPRFFGRTQAELDFHFGSCSTDDSPAIRVRIEYADDRVCEVSTQSNHAHLLPWSIRDPDARVSFNPQISIRLAELMPSGFLFRERLAESSSLFDDELLHRERVANWETQTETDGQTVSYEQQMARLNETLKRLAEVAIEGEAVRYEGIQVPYTASQLRQLSEEQLRDLVSQGYDLSTSDETGQTALMLAAFPPFNSEQFRKLVRVGADVNARRSDGLKGLMLACAGSDEKVVREWLNAGASVEVRGPNQTTALMLGAKNGAIVSDLLASGANVTDLDDDGDSALDYAMQDISIFWAGKRLKSIELLSSEQARFGTPSFSRSFQRALDMARQVRLSIEIDREFGGQTISEAIRDTQLRHAQIAEMENQSPSPSLHEAHEFIDLEITEIELADRIVELLRCAASRFHQSSLLP